MIILGDCLAELRKLPDESVHCCVTSPPYWGLRDYGVPGQLGLEKTPEEYVANMVEVFREVRRVLRKDGVLFLNLGDSYHGLRTKGLKPKDLVGIPWRVAFALQADGWYLRQDIIWAKPNPMPESVRDRCTKSHEYVFLLSKSERYYFDSEAIQEPAGDDLRRPYAPGQVDDRGNGHDRGGGDLRKSGNKERKPASARGVPVDTDGKSAGAVAGSVPWEGNTRNKRSVWTVTTKPFKEAHFATFPPEIPEICIKAGCPKGGVVLDPFFGAGTTGLVAMKLGREFIGIELNPEYCRMAERRVKWVQLALVP